MIDGNGQVLKGAPVRVADPRLSIGQFARREAYTRIRKSMVEYPRILTADDAVEGWIATPGKSMSGSPREVYFADFMNAAPDDEVVDIAFPVA